VLLRLPAEQPLISRFHFWPLMDEVFSSGEDVPVFRGEVDVGTPAIPARFLSQKAQALKPPQYLPMLCLPTLSFAARSVTVVGSRAAAVSSASSADVVSPSLAKRRLSRNSSSRVAKLRRRCVVH
jgi:hypothetical protein